MQSLRKCRRRGDFKEPRAGKGWVSGLYYTGSLEDSFKGGFGALAVDFFSAVRTTSHKPLTPFGGVSCHLELAKTLSGFLWGFGGESVAEVSDFSEQCIG